MWAAITAFLCVWLAAKNHILNWPVSIVSSLLYFFVFFQGKLYSDALLQVVFMGLQVYGWYVWSQRNGQTKPIVSVALKWFTLPIIASALAWLLWYTALTLWKSDASYPAWDSGTTILSLLAITMQARRILENWWVWILVDLLYVPLYWQKNLYLTALLYGLYIFLALWGWLQWKKIMQQEATLKT